MEWLHSAAVTCPHCGESFSLEIDTSQPEQTFFEDCTVCCRPIELVVSCEPGSVCQLHSEPA